LSAEEVKGWLGELLQLSKVEKRSKVEGARVEERTRILVLNQMPLSGIFHTRC
jgi:hypothetical protein